MTVHIAEEIEPEETDPVEDFIAEIRKIARDAQCSYTNFGTPNSRERIARDLADALNRLDGKPISYRGNLGAR